jgi:putative SOS response-associated peptidase YedK
MWLDGKTPIEDIEALLRPLSDDQMMTYAVGPWVNNARNEGPKCLEPAAPICTEKDTV